MDGPWCYPSGIIPEPLRYVHFDDLYAWQMDMCDLLAEKVNDRIIYWLWDYKGGSGKTALMRHLACTRDDVLIVGGRATDMRFAVAGYVEKNHQGPKVIILNLARTVEDFVSYQGIEQVKDALFANTKYESGQVLYNPPHLVVFANFPPDTSKLSSDRWKIMEITPGEGLPIDVDDLIAPFDMALELDTGDEWNPIPARFGVADVPADIQRDVRRANIYTGDGSEKHPYVWMAPK